MFDIRNIDVGLLALFVFIGIPAIIGLIAGLASVVSSTKGIHPHATPAWRYVDPAKAVEKEEVREQADDHYDPYNPNWDFDTGPINVEPIFELEGEDNTLPLQVAYESSVPSASMSGAIDELLAAVGSPVNNGASIDEVKPPVNMPTAEEADTSPDLTPTFEAPDEVEQLVAMSANSDPGDMSFGPPAMNSTGEYRDIRMDIKEPEYRSEPPMVAFSKPAIESEIKPQHIDNVIPFPMEYAPTPLAFDEYRSIERKYGTAVAQAITTTPSQGGSGKTDVMLGRLEENSVGIVLSYADHFVLLTGNVPMQLIGNPVLLSGQFVTQEEFYVMEWEDPEALSGNESVPFFDSKLTVSL